MATTSLALAAQIVGAEEEDGLLAVLCDAAEEAWKQRLGSGVSPESCGQALVCAAAFTAAADYLAKQGRMAYLKVGDVTVKEAEGASAAVLRAALLETADRLMAPYGAFGSFCFQGVRG